MRKSKQSQRRHEEYQNGYQAFRDGKPFDSCPFTIKSNLGVSWRAGWIRAEYKAKEGAG